MFKQQKMSNVKSCFYFEKFGKGMKVELSNALSNARSKTGRERNSISGPATPHPRGNGPGRFECPCRHFAEGVPAAPQRVHC